MGNALRFLFGWCCKPSSAEDSGVALGPHGVSADTVGVTALARDLLQFEIDHRVPEGLSAYVVSSKNAQAKWYGKLLAAWKETQPQPKTPEQVSRLVVRTLKGHQKNDVEGLLTFYGLPLPHTPNKVPSPLRISWPEGVKFELLTLPVDAKAIADGDTVTVYVSTDDPREASCIPDYVANSAVQRARARAERNYERADAFHKKIIDAGYRVLRVDNDEILARKYRIRLRGIDAPESSMPYGKEAREELVNMIQGKRLRVLVYEEDRYGRYVGDIHCDGKFVQKTMLKKGFAWHYSAYDKRAEFAKWEQEAQAKRKGLWASSAPEKPWDYRKNKREGR